MIFFKRLFIVFLLLCALSCQKEYAPELIATSPSTGGGSSSGGSGSAGTRLSKIVLTTGNVTVTRTYEYNSAGKFSKCSEATVIGSQSLEMSYTFTRDNGNKIISYTLNNNIPGFPTGGATYNCHYPVGSNFFDYATTRYSFFGTTKADSIVFGIANGMITSVKTLEDVANSGYQAAGNSTFLYDNAGNVSEYKFYNLSALTGNLVLVNSSVYSYDTKLNALQLEQEAFLLGSDIHFGKNNYLKLVRTDYATVAAGVTNTTSYTYTYNANNQPIAATGTDTNGGKAVITYTYQ